jgi:hypothetical protein
MGKNELAAIEAQANQQTFTIDCPAGCQISYRDPRAPVTIPRTTNGWDAAIAITQSVAGVANAAMMPAAIGYVAVEGFRRLQGSGAIDNSVAGNVNTGNSGRIDSADDYTSDPTVVNQPSPVIVTQPPVQVVPQPEPIIVPQPDPIIVQPTIVDQPVLVPGGV